MFQISQGIKNTTMKGHLGLLLPDTNFIQDGELFVGVEMDLDRASGRQVLVLFRPPLRPDPLNCSAGGDELSSGDEHRITPVPLLAVFWC